MSRPTLRTLKLALAQLGATLDESCPSTPALLLDAPTGFVWSANGCHCYRIEYANSGGQSWKPQALADAMAVLAHGLTPCEDAACDVCEGEPPA